MSTTTRMDPKSGLQRRLWLQSGERCRSTVSVNSHQRSSNEDSVQLEFLLRSCKRNLYRLHTNTRSSRRVVSVLASTQSQRPPSTIGSIVDSVRSRKFSSAKLKKRKNATRVVWIDPDPAVLLGWCCLPIDVPSFNQPTTVIAHGQDG
ncbi:hypothetical protein FRX31_013179 [Thalictrum thalictroides]|uniref:Uncharacterized protein n=1 Tax=Thalictrum thalictroides TaxID=46969 RepID=A0A7J6WIK7_THATH|nr:hypothetical protein FRX31_013179 [Thalictrum thalictroides]